MTTDQFHAHHPQTIRAVRLRTALAALVAATALLVGITAQPAAARTNNKTKAVLFVHGYSFTNNTNCGGDFDSMISSLRSRGFTGPMIKVGYYTGDTNCSMSLRSWHNVTNSSSWREYAKALSKYIHSTYTSKGVAVDIVGYSMGGLIARGAVYGSSNGQSGFSAPIDVEDVVTLGSPHKGAAWFSNACLWGQCATLKPGASDIKWLNQNGNPQGRYGTEFTVIGSNGDAVVPTASALTMSVPAARKVTYSNVPHTGSSNYMKNSTVVTRTATALEKANQ